MKHHHLTLVLIAALCAGASFSARAQDPTETYDQPQPQGSITIEQPALPKNKNKLPKRIEITDAPMALPNYGYTINFIHKDGTAPNEAVLRVSLPLNLSGCYEVLPPETTVKVTGSQAEIIVSDPVIKKDKTPQYGHNTCKKNTGTVVADAVLDRDLLIRKKVNMLRLKGSVGQEKYDLYVDTDRLVLYTKARDFLTNEDRRIDWHGDKLLFKPYVGTQTETPLTYWFYPENTVVLSVPTARADNDVSAEIKKFAQGRGMVALSSVIPDFEPPTQSTNKLYFVDQVGTLAQTLGPQLDNVGTVTVGETFYGPNGPYQRPKKLEVMASTPGLMD